VQEIAPAIELRGFTLPRIKRGPLSPLGNVLSLTGARLWPTLKGIRPLSNFVYANSIFRLIEDLFAELRSN
jgi:hypothetical protein